MNPETKAVSGATPPPAGRGTPFQRLRAGLLARVAQALIAIPEGPVNAIGEAAGELWYRIAPGRAARARRNLQRVASHLVTRGLANAATQAAAEDPAALERLVRRAFRQAARYYLDMVRLPGHSAAELESRLIIETPETVADAFDEPGPRVFVSMHFGAVEYPALFAVARTGRHVVAPMETLADPALQAWIERTRGSVGVDIVSLRDARRALTEALTEGRVVGMVADRNVAGGAIDVPFFGALAPLPMGPGLFAMEAGLPIWVAAVRRAGGGRYRGQLRRVDIPTEGLRRARWARAPTTTAPALRRSIPPWPARRSSSQQRAWPDVVPRSGCRPA